MEIITWNVRGLLSPQKTKILRKDIQRERPVVMFVQETKCTKHHLLEVGRKVWRNYEGVGIDALGHEGGLGILWGLDKISLMVFVASQ